MKNSRKTLLTLIVAASLFATTYFTSCLEDGNDTIVMEGGAMSEPEREPEPESEDSVDQSDLQGESGDLRFNLQWEGSEDVDLYVVTPCGDTICFYNRQVLCNGAVGQLDIDANCDVYPEHPQENIYWDKSSPGKYNVYVVNCSYDEYYDNNVDFTLTIISNNNRIDLKGRTERLDLKLLYSLDVK